MQAMALERIYRLFELAGQALDEGKPERGKRYVGIARGLAKKHRVRFQQELKTKYCKKCGAFLKEGINAELKVEGALTTVKCLECGAERKTGVKPESNKNNAGKKVGWKKAEK